MSGIIPETFAQWHRCITHDCGIALTQQFIDKRLAILRNQQHEETQRFIQHYGEMHRHRIVSWLQQARVTLLE